MAKREWVSDSWNRAKLMQMKGHGPPLGTAKGRGDANEEMAMAEALTVVGQAQAPTKSRAKVTRRSARRARATRGQATTTRARATTECSKARTETAAVQKASTSISGTAKSGAPASHTSLTVVGTPTGVTSPQVGSITVNSAGLIRTAAGRARSEICVHESMPQILEDGRDWKTKNKICTSISTTLIPKKGNDGGWICS
jgi:hypothetical protein